MFSLLAKFKRQPELSPASVLVIEDSDTDRAFIQGVLQRRYAHIILAESGPTGISLAAKEKVDVIILDYMLPQMNGLEVCRILKSGEKTRKIPIVFLTVIQGGYHMIECLEAGATVFLNKPIGAKELLNEIEITINEESE